MIRVKCPKCEKRMQVDDALAGGVGTCSDCGQKFRIPGEAAAKKGSAPAAEASDKTKPAAEAPARPKEDWEDEDSSPYEVLPDTEPTEAAKKQSKDTFRDKEYERLRKKKEMELKKEESRNNIALAAALLFVWIILGVLSFMFSEWAIGPLAIGSLIGAVGSVWLLIVAFKESALQGVLVLFVPCYVLYFVATNFAIAWKPFLLTFVGNGITWTALLIGGGFDKMLEPVKKLTGSSDSRSAITVPFDRS